MERCPSTQWKEQQVKGKSIGQMDTAGLWKNLKKISGKWGSSESKIHSIFITFNCLLIMAIWKIFFFHFLMISRPDLLVLISDIEMQKWKKQPQPTGNIFHWKIARESPSELLIKFLNMWTPTHT